MKIIERYFDQSFDSVKKDLHPLIQRLAGLDQEFDLQIRHNYFNLYYKGNSVGKVVYNNRTKTYSVGINNKFVNKKIENKFGQDKSCGSGYITFKNISAKTLNSLFSHNNLRSIGRKIKDIGFQEEIIFEQSLITDNADRKDLIIIDRQIVDHYDKSKMDLLAFKKGHDNRYQFCVIEVKLGNNPELEGKVGEQLYRYIHKIERYFKDYKECYEKNIEQKKDLGLIDKALEVEIRKGVLGLIVVGGYSAKAKKSIERLRSIDPNIKVIQLTNIISREALNTP